MSTPALMKKYGWKVGQKLPLHSTIWTAEATARSTGPSTSSAIRCARIRRRRASSLNRALSTTTLRRGPQLRQGPVGWYRGARQGSRAIGGRSPRRSTRCSRTRRTRPRRRPSKEFASAFLKQLGDIGLRAARDPRRRVLHAAVPDRQYHDAVGARAHAGARGAEDPGLHATPRCSGLVIAESLLLCVLAAHRRARAELRG